MYIPLYTYLVIWSTWFNLRGRGDPREPQTSVSCQFTWQVSMQLWCQEQFSTTKFACVRPGSIDPMTAVVQRVKGFAYYSLSFSRHNKNIKMEHFFLYILSRYFIWHHKWKGFNDICASLKHERMIDYFFQLLLILYPLRCRETISLRSPVFHRSHGHNLVRPGHQSEVNYGYVSKICR